MIRSGKIIAGRYRTCQSIGQGGMGIVFRAVDERSGLRVAIKFLRPDKSGKSAASRFRREAMLIAAVEHRNICKVIDVGIHDENTPFIVMPLLQGIKLSSYLKRKTISYEKGCDIGLQLLGGLSAAHARNIVHRDLKPSNIFLVFEAEHPSPVVKIMDFGVSKMLGETSRITDTGVIVGTIQYMAPEQAAASKDIDCRVDIYAAGLILYELFTGYPPFEGIPDHRLPLPIKPIQSRSSSIPDAPASVIMKALERDPAKRYPDGKAMLEAFESAVSRSLSDKNTDESAPEKQTSMRIPRPRIRRNVS